MLCPLEAQARCGESSTVCARHKLRVLACPRLPTNMVYIYSKESFRGFDDCSGPRPPIQFWNTRDLSPMYIS